MNRPVFAALLLFALGSSCLANDEHHAPLKRVRHRIGRTQFHDGSSPFPPPGVDDTLFVVDTGAGLDTNCTFRSGGPLVIHLPVGRYAGPTKGDGTLLNAATMVSSRLLSETAHLRMPAFDVDVNGDPSDSTKPPEVDRVLFNGHVVGTLTGDNDIWKLNEFEVPIDWVRFPSAPGQNGASPQPADNVIEIDIDILSNADNWCTSVDWAELDFKAVAPIFLVHGTFVQSSTWGSDFVNALAAGGALVDRNINLQRTGTIDGNGRLLAQQVTALATQYGAKSCHIVAHSKGGLDTRAYLTGEYDPDQLKVLSVYTLSTPHHGTPLADALLGTEQAISPLLLALQTALMPAPSAQSTSAMAGYNLAHPSVPSNVLFYNFGAQADVNGNGIIDAAEAKDLIPPVPATVAYQLIRYSESVNVSINLPKSWGDFLYPDLGIVQVSIHPLDNDVVVPVDSAHSPFGTYLQTRDANHVSMKTSDLATKILQHIESDFPNN